MLGGFARDIRQRDLDTCTGRHVGDRRAHHAGAEDHRVLGGDGWPPRGSPASARGPAEVEVKRLDHVLRDLSGRDVDEVEFGALDGGGHYRQRRRVVGALQLLSQVGRKGRQELCQLGARGRAAGHPVILAIPRLDGLRIGGDPRLGRRDQLLRPRDQLVDQAELLCTRRAVARSLKQHRGQRLRDAEQAHRAHHAAVARHQPKADLWQAEPDRVLVERNAVVCSERQSEAVAKRVAGDRRDDRPSKRFESPQLLANGAQRRGDRRRVGARRSEHSQRIAIGKERRLGRGDHDAADRVAFGGDLPERADERAHERGVEGVLRP